MNTRKLFVSITMFVCVLFAACAPQATVTQASPTSKPPAASAFAGDPIPDKYLNVDYQLVGGDVPIVARFYAPTDPICLELKTKGNCFTQLRVDRSADPGARGPAAVVNGLIAEKFQVCPYCDEVDATATEYFKTNDGVLVGVKCETKTGDTCNSDVGTTWKPVAQQTMAAQAPTAASALGVLGQLTIWHSPQDASFRLPVSFTYGAGWQVHPSAVGGVDIIYTGNPAMSQSDWWGGSIFIITGAQVADPKDMAKTMALPDDYLGYVSSLPGVKIVQGPSQVTIGGIQGSQIIVHTPAMHPILWLKGDSAWLGGGQTGVDPELERQMVLLNVNGEKILLEYDNAPDTFDERYPLVNEIFNSVTFIK